MSLLLAEYKKECFPMYASKQGGLEIGMFYIQ
uniref:Uncharacterized protein n=1 Tax=Rhizophora mucronata TaxID=61149 RepID=A0A2P2QU47_RHIMU